MPLPCSRRIPARKMVPLLACVLIVFLTRHVIPCQAFLVRHPADISLVTRLLLLGSSRSLQYLSLDDDADSSSSSSSQDVVGPGLVWNTTTTDDDDDDEDDASPSSTTTAILYRPEEDDVDCIPPGLIPTTRMVFLVSDATGVTARSTLLKSLAQFDTCSDEHVVGGGGGGGIREDDSYSDDQLDMFGEACDVQSRTFTFIRSTAALAQILHTAKEKEACVMYTMADGELRNFVAQLCTKEGIPHVDLMGPALDVLGGYLGKVPYGIPARFQGSSKRRTLGDSYYQRMDAVEFCLKADDGQSPWLLSEADVVIVGVSRSGKTPLSVVLSQTMSLKVANIPLVLEVPPPAQLLEEVDPRRVFCLTIAPTQLRKIRSSRLERRNVRTVEALNEASGSSQSNYADRNYLLKDLQNARRLSQKHNWTEIDVTGRAVEETATVIVEMFNERFQEQISPNSLR